MDSFGEPVLLIMSQDPGILTLNFTLTRGVDERWQRLGEGCGSHPTSWHRFALHILAMS
ncbi:hypothetical protein [Metallosphaera hakonensis]|uniref:hypothetical protein n=1 Tax=Metallosphaera hakonensis TaxID=79601 RepID=UPI00197B1D06|nr:hypothetical protein [Metallosphaera hakonensis]